MPEARSSDSPKERRTDPRALEGIPVLVKDNMAAGGKAATAGWPPAGAKSADTFLVRRLARRTRSLSASMLPLLHPPIDGSACSHTVCLCPFPIRSRSCALGDRGGQTQVVTCSDVCRAPEGFTGTWAGAFGPSF